MKYNIGEEVIVKVTGIIEQIDKTGSDGKVRYQVKTGFLNKSLVFEHDILDNSLCEHCGRELRKEEVKALPTPNGADGVDWQGVCQECLDYAHKHPEETEV